MSYSSNLISLSTSIADGFKEALALGMDLYSKLQKELFQNDDLIFERNFKTRFAPSLYDIHLDEQYANCIFCSQLTLCSCHKHCLKCSKGTYIYCSPLLPGILCYESAVAHSHLQPLPWLYKETCRHFSRLERGKYYRNLLSPVSWVKLYNFEVLEGISKGVIEGQKPCHICAAVDYEIYKDCLQSGETCSDSPCLRIADVVGTKIIEAACL